MSEKNTRKLGFFSALSICVGSIVGIGIFLKNASVGRNVDGNGITWLLTWIVSGLIALLVALNFAKISKINLEKETAGISSWVDYIGTKKESWFKKLVSFNYGFLYNAVLTVSLSFFTSELLIAFLKTINNSINIQVWVYVFISLLFMFVFILINYLSYKLSGKISVLTTVLKFIPLFVTIIIGIAFANNKNYPVEGSTINGFKQSISFSNALKGMMLSIPSVLFSFDSFAGIGALSKNIKKGDKTVSRVIIIGIISVTIIYLLICLASIFHYNNVDGTTIENVLIDSLPANLKKQITIIVSFFLFVSAFGTSNAIIGVGVKEFEHICYDNKVVFVKKLANKFGPKKGGLILMSIVISFWSIILFTPSAIMNNDSIIDGFSNLAVAFFFVIYALLIFYFWKNVYLKDTKFQEESNKTRYSILVWITIIGTLISVLLNLFFVLYYGITKWNYSATSWGLYLYGKDDFSTITNLTVLVIYVITIPTFSFLPKFNFYLLKKIDKTTIY